MGHFIGGVVAICIPIAIVIFVIWLARSGDTAQANELAALHEMAVRRGLKARDGASWELFVALGAVGGVELHVEQRMVDGRNHAQVRGRPARSITHALLVPRGPHDPIPEPTGDMREITVDNGAFDGAVRTMAADESATRAWLDSATRASLASFAGSTTSYARLTSLRCAPAEVTFTMLGLRVDAAAIDRAIDIVLPLCAPAAAVA